MTLRKKSLYCLSILSLFAFADNAFAANAGDNDGGRVTPGGDKEVREPGSPDKKGGGGGKGGAADKDDKR